MTLHSAIFDGFLAIDDPAAFRQALITGIGRGRGYGFGLLTIVPVPNPASDDMPAGA